MFRDAMTVLQDLIDTQSRALMAADTGLMRTTVQFPYRRITATTDMIIESEDDLRVGVNAFHQSISGMGVNHLIRLVTQADYLSAEYIEGRYMTHVLRNASAMLPPYENHVILRHVDHAWRVIEIRSELSGHGWPLSLLKVDRSIHDKDGDCEQDDIRRTSATPMALYQGFLNALTDATLMRDFAAYVALCDLPYTAHSNNVDTQMNSPDDVRPFFDMTVAMIDGDPADTFERVADNAQFLGSDLICGYHDTSFFRDGVPVMDTIKCRMILKRRGIQWKLKHVTNAVANPTFTYIAPEPTEALLTHREIQERTKSWPTLH